MNPGLRYLIRSRPRQLWRSLRKRFHGWKGALGLVVVFGFLVMILLGQIVGALRPEDPESVARSLADARAFGPLILFGMMALTLVSGAATRGGVYFRPAEIGFLFPAPVSRRQLLLYNLLRRLQVQALSALWVSIFITSYAASYVQALVGCFLALAFMEVSLQCLGLLAAALGKRIRWPLRLAAGAALALVAGLGLWRLREGLPLDGELSDVLREVALSPAVRVVVAPFVPFVQAFTAPTAGGALLWIAVSCVVLAAVVQLMFQLDVAYEEASLDLSRRVQQRLRRMRGGGAWASLSATEARRSLPRLPRLSGAGVLCWRQGLEALRNVRGILVMTGLTLLWPAAVGGVVLTRSGEAQAMGMENGLLLIGMVLFFSATLTQNLSFDFRRDLDRMPYLRSLPLRPIAVAAGQVAPAAILLASAQFVAVAALVLLYDVLPPWAVPFLLPVILLLAWVVVALDNGLFLLLPYSVGPEESGQMGFMGRLMLVVTLKFLVLGAVLVATVLVGAIAWQLAALLGLPDPGVQAVAAVAGSFTLLALCFALTWGVGRAFAAFDPARDASD